jgi:hypothetical protein
MNFICDPCKHAGELPEGSNVLFSLELKKANHSKCKGSTWCDCQHRVGRKNF